jgi:hypothetical protein
MKEIFGQAPLPKSTAAGVEPTRLGIHVCYESKKPRSGRS